MSAKILDGKATAARVLAGVRERAVALAAKGRPAGLATVLVGDDPASAVYVGQKIKTCREIGIESIHRPLPAAIGPSDLLAEIGRLNRDPRVHGVIVQLPLPKHLRPEPVLEALDPAKDADGLHPLNQGRWMALKSWRDIRDSGLPLPCTPAGVMELLEANDLGVAWRRAVVIGRSSLVGKPLALLLTAADATVTLAHSRTKGVDALCRTADVLIAALGQPLAVKGDWIKPGAVVIDVGINRTPDGLVGDVDFAAAAACAGAVSPVPGGVGPLTVAMLLQNTVRAAEKQLS